MKPNHLKTRVVIETVRANGYVESRWELSSAEAAGVLLHLKRRAATLREPRRSGGRTGRPGALTRAVAIHAMRRHTSGEAVSALARELGVHRNTLYNHFQRLAGTSGSGQVAKSSSEDAG